MPGQKWIVPLLCLVAVIAGFLAWQRSGVLAWFGLVMTLVLAGKHFFRPSPRDGIVVMVCLLAWVAGWALSAFYVYKNWESAEVVTLTYKGTPSFTARTWIVDTPEGAIAFYDAPAEVAQTLLKGEPIEVERGDTRMLHQQVSRRIDNLPESRTNEVLEMFTAKYGSLMSVSDIFYIMLGRGRDRVFVLIELDQPEK